MAAHSRTVGFNRNAVGSRLIANVLPCPLKACHQQLFKQSWVKSLIEVRSWFSFPLNLNIHVMPYLPWWLCQWRVHLQCRRPGFNPWVGKIPWRRKWQPTPVLLPGKSHGQRSLAGYSPWGHKESDTIERLTLSLFTFFFIAFLRDTIQPIVAPLSKFSIDLLGLEYWVYLLLSEVDSDHQFLGNRKDSMDRGAWWATVHGV